MLLRITHETRYDYAPGVDTAQHMAHLQPPDTPYQTCLDHRIDVAPPCADFDTRLDAFGNHRSYWAMSSHHQSMRVSAHSEVRTHGPQGDLVDAMARASDAAGNAGADREALALARRAGQPWEAARDLLCYAAGQATDAASEFCYASHHAPVDAAFAAYAAPSFSAGRPLAVAACELMERIHRDFLYEALSTEISTPALEVLADRRGVCQDFAHVLLACLRSLGLAARYVSGYMLTEPPPGQLRLTGADASHAWVAVYLPDLGGARGLPHGGWLDLDPTNNRAGLGTPGPDYVRLAVGRDFADVSPLRGVL
ncbi:MAG: transglutaminase family protein, partial [Rhodospirillales bacterium]|nr:transglutaminase family protein [Rhodospirillales bacterium]